MSAPTAPAGDLRVRPADGGEPHVGAPARAGLCAVRDAAAVCAAVCVAGLTAPGTAGTAYFAESAAPRLSGHPGLADAIAVLPRPGVSTAQAADQARDAVGGAAKIRTGNGRGAAEQPQPAGAKEMLTAISGSFGGIATGWSVARAVLPQRFARGENCARNHDGGDESGATARGSHARRGELRAELSSGGCPRGTAGAVLRGTPGVRRWWR